MALVIPPGFAQIVYRWTLAGDPEEMISTVGADTSAEGGATAINWREAWLSAFPAISYSSNWFFLGVRAYIGQDGGPPVIQDAPANLQGTGEQNTTPQNCSLLVRKSTALGGRAGRGRMFLPPFNLDEGNVDAKGMLDLDYLNDMQTLFNAVFLPVAPVILHDSATPGAPAPTPITGWTVDPRIATQRRRLR